MKISFFNSWKSENIIFYSNKSLNNLEDCIKDYIKEKEKLSLINKFTDCNNLWVHLTSKHDIEVQFYFQFLTFPGYGMTAKMNGKLLEEEGKTKVDMTLRIHSVLKFTLIILPLFLISSSLLDEFDFLNILFSILLSLLLVSAFLLYFKKYKARLIRVFKTTFELEQL